MSEPQASAGGPAGAVTGRTYRFTVLTSRLVRMEHSEAGVFVDAPTQLAASRDFEVPAHQVEETEDLLTIRTEHLRVHYDKKAFSPSGLSVTMRSRVQANHRSTWHYGDSDPGLPGRPGNLGGTARTLDDVDGAIDLGEGLLSANGFAVVDDSDSLLLTEDGWVAPRPEGAGRDLYFFGYGHDYEAALRDFFRLTGPTPLLPRYALGNWWSRYHRYSDAEYLALMDRFASGGIPFSVAVLDMDWHQVDIDPRLGSGWTGYTWNRELFPDPHSFLTALHDRDLRVTLNVHPADGVRAHEEAYPEVARDLGLDPGTGQEISFDVASRTFVESYLRRLHHPHEDIGVDFWWLDWQSGSHSRIPGLDPLWLLNHVHFLDSGRAGRRALILSRYAGLGSHRYPVGFSGDTVTSWASLRFQPEFTATASNVGYFWWSHDIGGHLGGAKDSELAARWVQLGTFSPINRLHSTNSVFNSKEPWRFSAEAERSMVRFLRLRHQLVPYLYTMNWLAHADGTAPVRPIYHEHPEVPEAYTVPGQYFFGPALMVAPITERRDRATGLARAQAWLPPGTWFDLQSRRRYQGGECGRRITFHRLLDAMPVLARAGSIIPLAGDPMADIDSSPRALELLLHADADGRFTLLEDDGGGEARTGERHETEMLWTWRGTSALLGISPPRGAGAVTRRRLTVELVGVAGADVRIRVGAVERTVQDPDVVAGGSSLRISLGEIDLAAGVEVSLDAIVPARADLSGDVFDLLDGAEIAFGLKEQAYRAVGQLDGAALTGALHAMGLGDHLYGAIVELVSTA